MDRAWIHQISPKIGSMCVCVERDGDEIHSHLCKHLHFDEHFDPVGKIISKHVERRSSEGFCTVCV